MKSVIKNTILKTITYLAGFGFMAGILSLDSKSWIPTILCVISGLWLAVFAYANGGFE